jgi:predicted amidohydrolase YtcJ
MDGVIETHTAAVLGSYADDTTQSGKPFWDSDKYNRAIAELDRRGFQIFTHAIGDRAVRIALDGYERAQNANGNRDDRPRIEHIETVSPQDIPRFGRLGVIASMQPLHAYPDAENSIWVRNAGPEREKFAFAWHSIEAGGGHLAFGSDWNVVTLNPWKGVQTALTRQTEEGNPGGGWVPSQRVTLEVAIRAYTLGAAFAGRREKTEGSLKPGKAADLIMLSQNLFEVDPHAVGRTTVLLTMVDGKTVYEAAGWAQQDLKGGPAKP